MYNEILNDINSILNKSDKDTIIIAIDGRCASGKTILCNFIKNNFVCNIFSIDDFFLLHH